MNPEAFGELRAAFDDLLAISPGQQETQIQQLGRRDPVLADELRKMLAAHTSRTGLLDRPAADFLADTESHGAPSLLGTYSIEKELGRGGMGVVYQARRADGSYEKLVAIKILRHDRVDGQFLRRFEQERRILAGLNHPHIAAILDAGTSPVGDPYFVMEHVDGVPITIACATLNIRQRLELFLQVCDAVQHAHRHLAVHRDLKPSNVLVTPGGGVKLLDFGIAKLMHYGPGGEVVPNPTMVVLTPDYASPEQIANQPITTATDVFSLGVLLYELLSGRHPFRGSTARPMLAHNIMRAIVEDDSPPMSSIAISGGRELRGELDTIVATAMRKQPSWRYLSVEQLGDDIGRYLRGLPVIAKGDGFFYRSRKFVRRHWLPVIAAAAIALALIAGTITTRRQARAAEQARVAAEVSRAHAEDETRIAHRNEEIAAQQRALAETRRREAESERAKEQARYRDLRSLSSSLLFDVYDGVRDLAGSVTARRLIVARAQRQLEALRDESRHDPTLLRDLAASYERMGELRADPRHPDKNNSATALEAYHRALELRRGIVASGGSAADRRDLALSLAKVGDGEILAGDTKSAVVSYQNAWKLAKVLFQGDSNEVSLRRALGSIDQRRCSVLLTVGDTAGSIEACREGIATLDPLSKSSPDDVEIQRLIAVNHATYANALRMATEPSQAKQEAQSAADSLHHLEFLAPNNAEYRRLSSSAEMILASSLAATGDEQASLDAFRRSVRSMEIAIEIDPGDLNSPMRLAVTLMAYSRRLSAGNRQAAAHDAAAEALGLLERTSENPAAGPVEWNEYADALLKADWPDLAQPSHALKLARKAVNVSNRTNPFFLDTLAWAYFRSGDSPNAAETEREALHLLPVGAKNGLHDELERGLATFLQSGALLSGKF